MKQVVFFSTLAGLVLVCATMRLSALSVQKNSPQTTETSVLYDKHCASCHGKDGQAKTFKAKFNHARNLTDAKWQEEVTDERIFNSISNGKGKMPAWGKKLSDDQINELVKFIRKMK